MLPLKNKTVLITRAADQSKEFIDQLQNLGANTITLPLIEITPINKDGLINKLKDSKFDWIIFTSPNAVRYFLESTSLKTINTKIAVVGEKTELVLMKSGINIDFLPSEFTAKHLAAEIPISTNDKILIPRSNIANNEIVKLLEKRKCIVEVISIYANCTIDYSKIEIEKIISKKIDFITFASSSAVSSFVKLNVKLNQEKVICIGPQTATTAKRANIKVTAFANPHTIEGMVKAIIETN